jgi:hypothetical protein
MTLLGMLLCYIFGPLFPGTPLTPEELCMLTSDDDDLI